MNAITVPDNYPLLKVDDILDFLGKLFPFMIFELDAISGYRQVPMNKESKPLTAYIFANGQKEYNFMPMRARNTAQFFQRNMDLIANGLT